MARAWTVAGPEVVPEHIAELRSETSPDRLTPGYKFVNHPIVERNIGDVMRDRVARLSPRQRECLYLVHEGHGGKAIAAALGISPNMVKEHLEAARRTLDVDRSMRAARLLVAETGLPPTVGGIEVGVGATLPPMPSGSPSATPAVAPEQPRIDVVREPALVYEPPSRDSQTPFPWPFRTRERRHNDVGPAIKLVQITVCSAILGALALVAVALVFAVRHMLATGLG